ncbi:transposable element Tcb1 transposase [Trichonephila clavipes]|nr:transposable element Tcb1 transposase [Trichonephila clavipes]
MQMIRISTQTHNTRACDTTSICYLRLGDFDYFIVRQLCFSCGFSKNDLLFIVEKKRSAFDHVSEIHRGGIVAYRDCGLSFREIGSRVGRNQTTVMRICNRWRQEGTMDRRGRSQPPQCTTSREDRQIVCMAVTDRSVTPRTVAQHIESVTHHSVTARTIRHRLQQSGLSARPLLGLPLTQNHKHLRYQWCDERRMWVAEWNEVVFTDESRICLQHHDGRIRVCKHRGERMLNSCVMHRNTGTAPGIKLWGGI